MNYADIVNKGEKKGGGKEITANIFAFKEPGDELVGKLLRVESFTGGKFDSACNQYFFETDEGQTQTILGAATDKQLEKQDVTGHVLRITFRGKISLEDGRQFNKFRIEDFGRAS